jgi:Uma2 family endonuclease
MLAHRGCEGAPDLVVEVLSPSTAQRDREVKRKLYATHGVQEYWLVNTEAAWVEIMSLGNNDFISQGTYSGEDGLVSQVIPGLALQASLIFAGV